MHIPILTAQIETRRNALNVNYRLLAPVDAVQGAIVNARAAALHGVADELDSIGARVAIIALHLRWTAAGGIKR